MTKDELAVFGEVLEHEPLKNHTTYKIGGEADWFVRVSDTESLVSLVRMLDDHKMQWIVLGRGSNVLVSDEPYHGVVISMNENFGRFHFRDEELTAQAGCSLIALAYEAASHSLSGLEFASGIPGSVGGGVYMNAGAYRSDISNVLEAVLVLKEGEIHWVATEDLDYTYRHSLFQSHPDWIILAAHFRLTRKEKGEIFALMDSRKQRRMASQPLDKPSAGSVFRNPEGLNAWKVVDDLGFRGCRCGGATVSEIHSNFIINETGQALAADVDFLIRQIQSDARNKMGVELIPEVERINWPVKVSGQVKTGSRDNQSD